MYGLDTAGVIITSQASGYLKTFTAPLTETTPAKCDSLGSKSHSLVLMPTQPITRLLEISKHLPRLPSAPSVIGELENKSDCLQCLQSTFLPWVFPGQCLFTNARPVFRSPNWAHPDGLNCYIP